MSGGTHEGENPLSRRNVLKATGAGFGTVGMMGAGAADDNEEFIVGLEPGASSAVASAHAASVKREIDFGNIGTAIAGQFSADAVAALESNDNVRYVERNGRMEALGDTVPYGIELTQATDAQNQGVTGNGVSVAVLDTGIDSTHETLQENLGAGWAADGAECGSGGGWPWETNQDCDEDWDDVQGHGTHVAGTVGAAANGVGVLGVAPDVTLHSVKVLDDSGGGSFSDIADGIVWATNQGHEVINMSLGGPESSAVADACDYAAQNGVVIVAAAGNDGPCTDCVSSPANHPEVIAVSATDENDSLAFFSSTGPEIEIAAPGVDVLSSTPGDNYDYFDGTSMASPHVAGAAASVIASGITDREQVRSALTNGADDIGLGGNEQGAGRLNVLNAIDEDGDNGEDDAWADVATNSATGVTDSSAELNGSLVDFDGADSATVWFEYGPVGTGFPNQSPTGSFSQPTDFFWEATGLDSSTDYEFRAMAEVDGVVESGGTETFTTDSDGGGCFLTTATANDYQTLDSLRRFRDDSMKRTPVGRGMVGLYYRISPPIAETLDRHPDSRTANAVRSLISLCASLSDKQAETDSRVKSAAVGVMLTMLYIVGIVTAATGHTAIRAREQLD